ARFWDTRWSRWYEIMGPFAKTAIFVPVVLLGLIWLGRQIKTVVVGKEAAAAPEGPRLPYSPQLEQLRKITLYLSGGELVLWATIGVMNQIEEPIQFTDAISVLFVAALPAVAAFIMSLLRRGPRTAAVLAIFALTMLLPQLVVRIL